MTSRYWRITSCRLLDSKAYRGLKLEGATVYRNISTYGSLSMIELHTTSKAALSKQAGLGDDKLIKLKYTSVSVIRRVRA